MSIPSRTDFWGVELTAKKKEAVWDVDDSYVSRLRIDEGDDEAYDPDIVHTLHIQRVILGPNAKDEDHLVTMTAQNFYGEDLTHPLCWLNKKSVLESQCSMHMALPPPVTVQLAQGSGPVHVIGIWEQQLESYDSDEDEEEEDKIDNAMDSLDTYKPPKEEETKQKKRPATSPPPKPAKVAKKDEKVSKSAAVQKKPIVDQDGEDDEEEEEDEEDGEQEDDDDDDENEEESDDEGEEEEEEDDSEDEPSPPPKKKAQTKAGVPKQKANMPKSIGDKAAKKPGKGTTPQASRSLDELKAMLAKSPNVPKKREKFNNYLQNNLKVTDPDVKNKLWNFVQQSKH